MESHLLGFEIPSVGRWSNHLQTWKGTDLWPEFQCKLNAQITENEGHGFRFFFWPEIAEEMLFQASLLMGQWEQWEQGRGSLTTATVALGEGCLLERSHLARSHGQGETGFWGRTTLYRGGYRASKPAFSQACPVLVRCRYFPMCCPGSVEWHPRPKCWLESNLFY